jgi:hypothetical protein
VPDADDAKHSFDCRNAMHATCITRCECNCHKSDACKVGGCEECYAGKSRCRCSCHDAADPDEIERLAREARAAYDETWPKGDSWLNVARFILTRERELLKTILGYASPLLKLEDRISHLGALLDERKP